MTSNVPSHPLTTAVEEAIKELGIDVTKAKIVFEITSSGQMYEFILCGTPTAVMLPLFITTRNSNVLRFEFQIGCIPENFQYQALGIIMSDLDMHRHSLPVRPVIRSLARVKGLQIYLQFLCEYDFISAWSIGDLIAGGAELGGYYRELLGNEFGDKTPLSLVG